MFVIYRLSLKTSNTSNHHTLIWTHQSLIKHIADDPVQVKLTVGKLHFFFLNSFWTNQCWLVAQEMLKISILDMSVKMTNLTHRGRMMHIYISKLIIIGSDNCLLPGHRQAIIWTNAGILLIAPLGANSEILIIIHTFSFKKMHVKMSSVKL